MKLDRLRQRELDSLLAALVDGQLDESGRRRLADLLNADPAAICYYIDYLDLHQQLADPMLMAGLALTPQQKIVTSAQGSRRSRASGWLALAACVTLGLVWAWQRPSAHHPSGDETTAANPPGNSVRQDGFPLDPSHMSSRPELPDLAPTDPGEPKVGVTMLDPALDDPSQPWCYLAKSTTVIGVPFQPDVTQVTYDGALYTKNAELCFFYGHPQRPLMARQKNFLDGWIPVVQYAWSDPSIRYEIEMFAAALDGEDASNTVNFVRLRARNVGHAAAVAVMGAAMRGSGEDGRMGNARFDPAWKYDMSEEAAYRNDALVYSFTGHDAQREAIPGTAYREAFNGTKYHISSRSELCLSKSSRELAPGESMTMEFKMPREPVPRSRHAFLTKLAAADYQTYRDHTVQWWNDLLAAGAMFEFPEKCIQDAQRASLVHVMLATRTRDGRRIQTDGLPYPNFFLTASPQEGLIYLTMGHPELAKELIAANAIKQQEPDGHYQDRELAHGNPIPAAHGHVLYISALSALYARDRKLGEEIFPSLTKAVAYLERAIQSNPYGLLPATYPYDNEMIAGHYASNNYWALLGLRNAIRLARFLDHPAEAEAWTKLEQKFNGRVIAGITASAKSDGYVPPGLYPYLTGEKARRGFREYQTGCDWENMLLAYPAEILAPGDPRVRGTVDRVRQSYAEGIMTYRHGQHLHQYITANQVDQSVAMGDSHRALTDFYHILLHTGPTYECFENLVRPWTDRNVEAGCPPPHAWASSKLAVLIRNLVLLEYGGKNGIDPAERELWLFHCLSPAWTQPGDTIRMQNAPTEFGPITASLSSGMAGAEVKLAANFHTPPARYRIRIPYYKDLLGITTDARQHRLEDNCIVLSPDATQVTIEWRDKPDAHASSFADLLTDYRKANSFAGVNHQGEAIIQSHAPFLTPAEQQAASYPLSFALVREAFTHEYRRRCAASLKIGGKVLRVEPPAFQSPRPAKP